MDFFLDEYLYIVINRYRSLNPTGLACRKPTEIYSRIVGYLRPINQWNNGKQAEFNLRETFDLEPVEAIECS